MKLRCAILDDYQNVALTMADWTSIADRVEVRTFNNHLTTESEVIEVLSEYEILIIMRERTAFQSSVLAQLPRLKLLITTGMRNASIDMKYAQQNGIIVCGTNGSSAPPAELTWALILGLTKNLIVEHDTFREGGQWQSTICSDLQGKTLGLLGLGKIGSRVAKIANSFGMEVVAWSQNLTEEQTRVHDVQLTTSKEKLLEVSDIVSVHLVLSERTRNLLDENDIRRMKSSAYLINTSRSAIVNQDALVNALRNKWIAGAGLDVFDIEPLPINHELRSLPNVLATPHLGYVSENNYQIFYQQALEDIIAYLAGSPIRTLNVT